jgi:3-phenylpropionate/trans-cinnamate dioxygenase ferredoxin subunit
VTLHDVARLGDLVPGTPLRVIVGGTAVAVVLASDTVYAVDDRCSHADVSLSEGDVEGCFIECWLHGSQFDLRTGEPTCLPATEPIATFATLIEGTGPDARVLIDGG